MYHAVETGRNHQNDPSKHPKPHALQHTTHHETCVKYQRIRKRMKRVCPYAHLSQEEIKKKTIRDPYTSLQRTLLHPRQPANIVRVCPRTLLAQSRAASSIQPSVFIFVFFVFIFLHPKIESEKYDLQTRHKTPIIMLLSRSRDCSSMCVCVCVYERQFRTDPKGYQHQPRHAPSVI